MIKLCEHEGALNFAAYEALSTWVSYDEALRISTALLIISDEREQYGEWRRRHEARKAQTQDGAGGEAAFAGMTISERRRAMLDGIRQEIAQKQAQLDKIRQALTEHRSAVLRGIESPLVEGRLDAEGRPLLPETVLDHLDRTEASLVESIGVLERQATKIVTLLGETAVDPRPI